MKIVENGVDFQVIAELIYVGHGGAMYEPVHYIKKSKTKLEVDWSDNEFIRDLTPAEATKYIKYIL